MAPARIDPLRPIVSSEPAGKMVLDTLGNSQILANMCLGEGTGAVMGFTIAEYAFKAYWEIPSFIQTNFGTYEKCRKANKVSSEKGEKMLDKIAIVKPEDIEKRSMEIITSELNGRHCLYRSSVL